MTGPIRTAGVIGLGRMGSPIAHRLATHFAPTAPAGTDRTATTTGASDVAGTSDGGGGGGGGGAVVVFDVAPPASDLGAGVVVVDSVAAVARRAEAIVLSLPDAEAVAAVVAQIAGTDGRATRLVVDCSTIGVAGAQAVGEELERHDIAYLDAAVSGGVAGAEQGTLTAMCGGVRAAFDAAEPLLATFASRRFVLGDRPGTGQAAKVANNYLSAVALIATSDAVRLGVRVGIDPADLLAALDASSGRNAATSDKFPHHVVTGTFAAGFANSMMRKDVALYRDAAAAHAVVTPLSDVVDAVWQAFAGAEPGADITRIHTFLQEASS